MPEAQMNIFYKYCVLNPHDVWTNEQDGCNLHE